jgi:hypothetical protein
LAGWTTSPDSVKGADAQAHAERAINTRDKDAWLKIAGEWIKLAQAAEKRAK